MDDKGIVVIGAGQAALQFASSLRGYGYNDPLTLLGCEPHAPYMRPPLSKSFLKGESESEDLGFRNLNWFADQEISLMINHQVETIHPTQKAITVNGRKFGYDKLVIATGTRARGLPLFKQASGNSLYLRTLDDAVRLMELTRTAQNVVVVGGGFIGLEYASAARTLGKDVTVIEAAPRLMARAVSPFISDWFADLHRNNGVDLRLSTGIKAVNTKDGHAQSLVLETNEVIPCDVVVIGVGALPNAELAENAGITTENGIVVDAHLRTSDSHIWAIGDCCQFQCASTAGLVRLESVQNAVDQAKYLAGVFANDYAEPYRAVPWFWTEQFGIKLQITGISSFFDAERIIGDPDKPPFSVEYGREIQPDAVFSFNDPRGHFAARKRVLY